MGRENKFLTMFGAFFNDEIQSKITKILEKNPNDRTPEDLKILKDARGHIIDSVSFGGDGSLPALRKQLQESGLEI